MAKTSATAVSRSLKVAGLVRSETHTTRVRGYHTKSTGFRVRQLSEDQVQVSWQFDHWDRLTREEQQERSRRQLERAVEILLERYDCDWETDYLGYSVLNVTAVG